MLKVTNSSTKTEILAAYEELLEQLKTQRNENSAMRQEVDKKQGLLEKATAATRSNVGQSLQQMRQALNEQLDQVENGLTEEQKKFEMLREATALLKTELDNLYQIKAEAESLEALVAANKQGREKLEREMGSRREQLEAEIGEIKTKWTREQEAYEYDLRLKRRNEQDIYNEKKAKMEKDLADRKADFDKSIADRERAVAEQETELKRFRSEVEGFETKLQKSVQEAEKAVTERLTREFEYQQKLQVKDLEAELRLREQMISSLEIKVKEQVEQVLTMSAKTDTASQQVKDIALRAIEKSGLVSFPTERRREDKAE